MPIDLQEFRSPEAVVKIRTVGTWHIITLPIELNSITWVAYVYSTWGGGSFPYKGGDMSNCKLDTSAWPMGG